jgi:hypothetical protein
MLKQHYKQEQHLTRPVACSNCSCVYAFYRSTKPSVAKKNLTGTFTYTKNQVFMACTTLPLHCTFAVFNNKKNIIMSNQTATISKDALTKDFRKALEGKVSEDVIKATEKGLAAASTAYAANGSIASLIIYQKCQCQVSGGKTFNGSSWGFAIPGGGALIGTVYTDDINRLYSQTTNFAVYATPVYTAFYFYDGPGNLLGHFQAGSISTVAGSGGGYGSWS